MKSIIVGSVILALTGCAFVDGVKNQQYVVQPPAGVTNNQTPPANTVTNGSQDATINAAKMISPATH